MKTQLISIITKEDYPLLDPAAFALQQGEVVGIPTETVYGLGANAYLPNAVAEIFRLKGRPSDNPLILHISDLYMAEEIALELPTVFYRLAQRFWPGPLTMIVKKQNHVPDEVTAGLSTVGIRMPENPVARELIRRAGCPVAAPSANLSGGVSATTAQDVLEDFGGKIPYVVDGGEARVGLESTVLDLTGSIPLVLRPGGVTLEELKKVLLRVELHESLGQPEQEVQRPASPGMKYKHYSPSCPVVLALGTPYACQEYILEHFQAGDSVFAYEEQKKLFDLPGAYSLGSIQHTEESASRLFRYLREADRKRSHKIYISSVEEKGMGLAIMNRIKKTAADHTVKVKKVLFVCTGNTCRSPMAECLLKNYQIDGLLVASRGLYVPKSAPMSANSKAVLENNQIPCEGFASAQLTKQDLEEADVVYTMTKRHRDEIVNLYRQFSDKVVTLKPDGDISDPFMQELPVYEEVFREIQEEIKRLAHEFQN